MKENKDLILVVDDQPNNLKVISGVLSNDYNLSIADSGESALKLLENLSPDLILLDIMMPGIDGYEVCKQIKNSDRLKDIPIIFLTAKNNTEDIVKGFDSGAVDFITKPFHPREVKSRIHTHLSLSHLRKRLQNINIELEQMVKERTEALLIEKNRAEESSRVKSYFLSLMSHELKTPMNGILGFSRILAEELKDSNLGEFAQKIYLSSQRLHHTLDSILNLANLESSKIKPNYTFFNLIEKTKNIIKSIETRAITRGIEITFNSSFDELNIYSDELMIELIFFSVLDNAIKFTNQKQIIIEISVETKNRSYIIIKIIDFGPGIPPEKQTVIFEEFRQVDEGFNRAYEGTGLGLALVRRYLKLLNGEIELKSKLGEGTTIVIRLPFNTES